MIKNAFVTPRMDYCNCLLLGLPRSENIKIQIMENSAPRLVTKTRKYDHIAPILQGLHRLPVHQLIRIKLIYATNKIVHGAASQITLHQCCMFESCTWEMLVKWNKRLRSLSFLYILCTEHF